MSEEVKSAKVTAVVVTYQSANTLDALFAAARRCKAAKVLDFIFVDNGSTDATPQILAYQTGWADVEITGVNNGFGRGCNIGLAKVKTPYTLFLNPDAQIEPEAIQTMVAFLDAHPLVGVVGPATQVADQHAYQATSSLPTPWSVLRASIPLLNSASDAQPILPGSEPFQTGWVCGAVFMIRTDLAWRLGGFDPRYFLYWEEMDLCHRVADAGFQTWALGNALASHICGASSVDDESRIAGCIGEHFYQSRRYYMVNHHGWLAATLAELGEFAFLCLRTCADVLRGKGIARIRPRMQAPLLSQPKRYAGINLDNEIVN
jgi:hypothetical protein